MGDPFFVLNVSFLLCVISPEQARLCEFEDQAKASKKGLWSEGGGMHTIRDMKYTIENPRNFVDSLHQKPINGNELRSHTLYHPSSFTSSFLLQSLTSDLTRALMGYSINFKVTAVTDSAYSAFLLIEWENSQGRAILFLRENQGFFKKIGSNYLNPFLTVHGAAVVEIQNTNFSLLC